MLDIALSFIKKYISNELSLWLRSTVDVSVDSISKDSSSDNLLITLINIEEEKIYKNQDHYVKANPDDSTISTVNPEIKLNIYVLFSAQNNDYIEALKQISAVITIFQGKNVFENNDFIANDITGLDTLIVELYSLTFEQNNSLWQTLGSKMVPAVLYKIKLFSMQNNQILGETGEIRGIGFNTLSKS